MADPKLSKRTISKQRHSNQNQHLIVQNSSLTVHKTRKKNYNGRTNHTKPKSFGKIFQNSLSITFNL